MVQWSNANEKVRWQRKIQFYRVRRKKNRTRARFIFTPAL